MREAIAAPAACPWSSCLLLAQDATRDGLLQGRDACLPLHLGHLPQQLRAHLGAQHGAGQHELARGRL